MSVKILGTGSFLPEKTAAAVQKFKGDRTVRPSGTAQAGAVGQKLHFPIHIFSCQQCQTFSHRPFFSHMDVARIACIQDAYIVHTRQSIHHVALFLADHCIIERFSQSFVQGSQFHLQKRKFAFPKPAPALNQRFHGFVVKCMPAARIVILSLIPDDAPHPIGSHTAQDVLV